MKEWQVLSDNRVLCLLCHQHLDGYGVNAIERKSITRHINTLMHKEAEAALTNGEAGLRRDDFDEHHGDNHLDDHGGTFENAVNPPTDSFVSLSSMEIRKDSRADQAIPQSSTLSDLIQKLIYISSQTDNDFIEDPMGKLQDLTRDRHYDSAEYWSDRQFASEMGFSNDAVAEEDLDTMLNVMQRLGIRHSFFRQFLLTSDTFLFQLYRALQKTFLQAQLGLLLK